MICFCIRKYSLRCIRSVLAALSLLTILLSIGGMYIATLVYESKVWEYIENQGSLYRETLFLLIVYGCGLVFLTGILNAVIVRMPTSQFLCLFSVLSFISAFFCIGVGILMCGFYFSTRTAEGKVCGGAFT